MTTSVQEERLRRRFDMWDKNGDGTVDRSDWAEEAQRILASFGESESSPKGRALTEAYLGMWEYVAGQAGIGPDGALGFGEFAEVAQKQVLERGQAGFDQVLRPTISAIANLCDTDGDGQISPAEFQRWMQAVGSDETTADTAFGQIDTDGDGQLSVEELVEAVHRYHSGELEFALL
ncbi:EF-hand domain-containing protein [Streptomyces lomondensis]|uniref:Calcium-binding protein n=1 Tax=Streptomyces lomondensis TaxID=68229 RepID=A0ABQ2X5V9_9ACTN|nr:EF-hand domain-containing protein [Streptomyces lomondensis]MCF0078206.1 EF-hand domain-containing protein [Streptomyces lomondensis]GGX01201.1 calcium-binding protein [Streptomyces lomondensis]